MLKRALTSFIHHPYLVILTTLAISVFFAFPIPKLDFSASSDTLMTPGDPERKYFESVKDIFGDDQVSIVCLIAEKGIYNPEIFRKIERMTQAFQEIEGVKDVVSLTNIRNIRGEEETITIGFETMRVNRLDTGKLIKKIPETPDEWKDLRKRIAENPLYTNNIVSADEKATGINIFLDQMPEETLYAKDIVGQIERIIESESGPGVDLSVTGIVQTKVETSRYMRRDLQKFIPYTTLLIAAVLYVTFKRGKRINAPLILVLLVIVVGLVAQSVWKIDVSFRDAMLVVAGLTLLMAYFDGGVILLPLASTLLSVEWTLGLMGYLNMKFSLVTTVLPSLLISIGIAYSIHVMSIYYHEESEEKEPIAALVAAVTHIGLPVFVTALTTVIGFASLMISKIPAIQDMGILAVFGVIAAFVLSLSFVPAVIAIIEKNSKRADVKPGLDEEIGGWLAPLLARIGEWDLKYAGYILATAAVVSIICLFPIPKIKVDTDFMSYFGDDDPIIIAKNKLTAHLAGSAPFFVVVDAGYPGAFEEPRLLKKLEQFQTFLRARKGVDITISPADYVKLTNRATYGNKAEYFRIPDSRNSIAQLLESLSGDREILEPYLSPDHSMANIMVRTRIIGSHDTMALARSLNKWAKEHFPEASVKMTGTLYLLNKTADNVARGQTQSLFTAVFTIFLVMSALFLSFKFGLLSMIPNIFPVLVLFTVIGFFQIPLDLSTSIIASIVTGIAVDDTIHFLSQFNYYVKKIYDERRSVIEIMKTTGQPVVYTIATLCFGFLVVSFSNFKPIYHFGLLTAFILFVGLIAEIVMLPSILRFVKIITLWDLLGLKLGKDPKNTVRIFQGLTNREARIAALLASIKPYPKDSRIITEGEIGAEMFVIVKGKVKIYSGDDSDSLSIAILGQGDNFGETDLVSRGPCWTSAVALENVELLVLDQKSLSRIERRYPRIATRIYLNLTRILSDRLQITTLTAMLRGKE